MYFVFHSPHTASTRDHTFHRTRFSQVSKAPKDFILSGRVSCYYSYKQIFMWRGRGIDGELITALESVVFANYLVTVSLKMSDLLECLVLKT